MGKNIGGTLGAPVEFWRQTNDFKFYTHDLNGEPLPNDDLDLQIIWLKCFEKVGPNMTARDLAEYWNDFQVAYFSEYGNCKNHIKSGIIPPLTGTIDNNYKDSNGAFIRSEIWACLCPGRPDLAVQYAYEDAIVDHGNGEGTYAEFFTAAMESAAFVESDFKKLVTIGLSYIPEDCGVAKAVKCAIDCYDKKIDYKECREILVQNHRGYAIGVCSKTDEDKGYRSGYIGYDVPLNIAIIVAGMLYGEGDFDNTMYITNYMGEDTDCTDGTVGAIFGIIYGVDKIPQKWIEPIGHSIQTICINMAHIGDIPLTVEDLTERVIKQAQILSLFFDGKNEFKTMEIGDTDDLSDVDLDKLYFQNTPLYLQREVNLSMNGPRFDTPQLKVAVNYDKTYLSDDEETKITLMFAPQRGNDPMNVRVEWFGDVEVVAPQSPIIIPLWAPDFKQVTKVDFYVRKDSIDKGMYEAIVKITVKGRSTNILIPITLMNTPNFESSYIEECYFPHNQ